MEIARITARGQTTIPKRIRVGAGLREGDVVAFEIEGDHLIVRKVATDQDAYLRGLSATMSEWVSPEDEEAWRDL
ncbi:MAG: AbrB/MazE/SpoVT family DNA-binding domain-containing protein [Acidobacteria bacterium]|nr:AbrB/MazE/SpoVT family DNA-binding domain-containing protein [Acidobacteriota bacterium]MXZ72614.1 AbrB/MazE/SpoVT family DNA-binding domain-containing protein [Acidobacteriota bacterium]MYD71056.1 AbrB/MazE/SpoVT family DNA-binding domain-containing protein [Acidobacteriota bacterium]MYJ03791.1 AbrB/MazE/SpoVT family DNA-binding domain-containing protein [Acidobacteriota bacterium]